MNSLPPLDVRVNAKRWSCVLDIGLALSPWGLMTAWRLADEMNVWLVPSLWDLLDGADYYLGHPESLAPEMQSGDRSEQHQIVETLGQWQSARLEADFPSIPLYWAGDASHESLIPTSVDAEVIHQFTRLAEALDVRLRASDKTLDPGHPYLDCTRDAVALSAALGRYRPIILTLADSLGEKEEPPAVTHYLEACGIACRRAPWPAESNPMMQHLMPMLVRSGVAELAITGVPLVALHVVAPRAFFMAANNGDGASYSETVEIAGGRTTQGDWWDHAVGLWYPLT